MRTHFAAICAAAAIAPLAPAQPDFNVEDRTDPGPVLSNDPTNFNEFVVTTDILLLGPSDITGRTDIRLDRFSIVLQFLPTTSAHEALPDTLEGELRVDRRVRDTEPRILDGYQGGTTLALWETGRTFTDRVRLRAEQEVIAFETNIDEARAAAYPWPAEDFEMLPEVRSFLEPQLFVESNEALFTDLVNEWTRGKPRSVPPYILAKVLAANVLERYQPEGVAFETVTRGLGVVITNSFVNGLRVRGALPAALEGRGSPLDFANYLCAVYRAAGIPARVVIGIDTEATDRFRVPQYVSWVEFWIHDPVHERSEWIPVDIVRQREFSTKAPPIDERWQFFGRGDQLDEYVPLAFHWHPPTVVVNAGPAALWGWLPEPMVPAIDQVFTIVTRRRAITASDLEADNEFFIPRTGAERTGRRLKEPTTPRR